MHKSKMSNQERRLRSQLTKMIQWEPFLHGTLNSRKQTCGKSECKCYSGEKHPCLVVVRTRQGKPRQLYVPRGWEQKAREWVKQYQDMIKLMDQVSEIYWKKIQKKEK